MRLRTCPNCGSANVTQDAFLFFLSGMYFCKKCGYKSPLFPEIDVRPEDMKRLERNRPLRK